MPRKPNIQCRICHKDIYRRPSAIERNQGNAFCGQTCYGISCRKEIPCAVCGKMILGSKHAKTCSKSCSNINRTGIKYNQKGRPSKSKVKNALALRKRLMDERGPKCESCLFDNINILQVHHVIRKADGGSNDLENLKLLCPNCHYTIHRGDSRMKNFMDS